MDNFGAQTDNALSPHVFVLVSVLLGVLENLSAILEMVSSHPIRVNLLTML